MKLKVFAVFDYLLFFSVLILITIGIAFIYSSGINANGVSVSNEYKKQFFFALFGLALLIVSAVLDYRKAYNYITYAYIIFLVMLLYTCVFGRFVSGARSWLGLGEFGVQPSEFGKIIFILYLARYLERSATHPPLRRFLTAGIIVLIPIMLILLQPDLGTASVYIPIFLVMCFIGGIEFRYIGLVFLLSAFTIIFTVLPLWESEILRRSVPVIRILRNDKLRSIVIIACGIITVTGIIGSLYFKHRYYYWITYYFGIITSSLIASFGAGHVLKDYQIKRLIVFLNPNSDPRGSGWHIIQSKIAIGSGNIFGQGFLKGTQSHYRFLPQQSTDFIFSILSEEWGFVGGIIVFALYFAMLVRTLFIIKDTTNMFGSYIAAGIFGMLLFHFIVNVGMVMGIMPITGIPLMFLSYGGSSLWTAMICIGLLMGINYRRLSFSF